MTSVSVIGTGSGSGSGFGSSDQMGSIPAVSVKAKSPSLPWQCPSVGIGSLFFIVFAVLSVFDLI